MIFQYSFCVDVLGIGTMHNLQPLYKEIDMVRRGTSNRACRDVRRSKSYQALERVVLLKAVGHVRDERRINISRRYRRHPIQEGRAVTIRKEKRP